MLINTDNNIAGYKDIDVDGVIAKQKQYYNRFKSMVCIVLLYIRRFFMNFFYV